MEASEFRHFDGLGLAELVKNGEVSPKELVSASIAQIERANPKLNAVIYPLYATALEHAEGSIPQGLFQGVPFLVKDLIVSIAGVPTQCGSRYLRHFVRSHDSEIIKRYRAAGLIFLGKTNTPEMGLSPVTESVWLGPALNPWDLSRTSGGSSGGSAVAVVAGMVPMAHGGDGGGSLRIPASCCGVFGFKPTRGRTPTGPDVSRLFQGGLVEHAITRSVRDSAALLDVVTGVEPDNFFTLSKPSISFLEQCQQPIKPCRIAVCTEPLFESTVHPDCLMAVQDAAKLCESLGHQVEYAVPKIESERLKRAYLVVTAAEVVNTLGRMAEVTGRYARWSELEVITRIMARFAAYATAVEFGEALGTWDRSMRDMQRFFSEFDVLLTPTLARPPLKVGELKPNVIASIALEILDGFPTKWSISWAISHFAKIIFDFIPFTPLFNMSGNPAMSVPLYWNGEGLPIGVQFAAGNGRDGLLFQLASQLEAVRPWRDRIPSI